MWHKLPKTLLIPTVDASAVNEGLVQLNRNSERIPHGLLRGLHNTCFSMKDCQGAWKGLDAFGQAPCSADRFT